MPSFQFTAYDQSGAVKRGHCEADTAFEAAFGLQQKGLIPVDVKDNGNITDAGVAESQSPPLTKANSKAREEYLNLVSPLMSAGVSIIECHRFLSKSSQNKRLTRLVEQVAAGLLEGKPYSTSLAQSEFGFNGSEIAIFQTAEQSGHFIPAVSGLLEKYKRNRAIREKVASAAIYPAVLFFTAIASVTIICLVLVPNILPLYSGRENDMPLALSILQGLTSISGQAWAVGSLMAVLLAFLSKRIVGRARVGNVVELLAMKFSVTRHFEAARVSNDLSMFLQAGHTLQSALRMAVNSGSFSSTRAQIAQVKDATGEGRPFNQAVGLLTFFDPTDQEMLKVAMASNKLELVLGNISEKHESKAIQHLERIVSLITPVMTLVMGLLVCGLVMIVMQSILSLNRAAL